MLWHLLERKGGTVGLRTLRSLGWFCFYVITKSCIFVSFRYLLVFVVLGILVSSH